MVTSQVTSQVTCEVTCEVVSLLKMFAVLFFAGTGFFVVAQTSLDYDFTIQDIEFRPDVFIDINVNVYVNENAVSWASIPKPLWAIASADWK